MSIPGWEPTPKHIEDWLDRHPWTNWVVAIAAGLWFLIVIVTVVLKIPLNIG